MKIAVIVVRVLMGLLFLFASVSYFLKLGPQPELKGDMKLYMVGMQASVYLLPLVKAIELLCAVAFLSGRFVPLAVVVIFPIIVNILLVNVFLAPEGIIMGVLLLLANLFLAYAYRKNYESLLASK